MSTLLGILGVAGTLVGIAAMAGLVLVVVRVKGLQASLDLFEQANGELRQQNEDLRTADAEHRRECGEQIAHLEGKVSTLGSSMVRDLAEGVASATGRAVADSVEAAVASGVERGIRAARE